jgi:hypothetical protein
MIVSLPKMTKRILLCVFLCSAVSSYGQSQPPSPTAAPISQNKENQASENEGKTNVNQEAVAPAIQNAPAVDHPGNFSNGQREQHQKDTSDKDVSDVLTAIATLVVALFTGLLWFSTHKLWQASRDQSLDTKKSLEIGQKSVEAIAKIAAAMEDSTKKQVRAYVGVITPTLDAKHIGETQVDKFPHEFSIFIKNFGQTPAYSVLTRLQWQSFRGRNVHWPDGIPFMSADIDSIKERGSSATLGIGQIIKADFPLSDHPDGGRFIDAFESFKRNEITIYLHGIVTYKDIFKDNQFTRFCLVMRQTANTEITFFDYDRNNEAS